MATYNEEIKLKDTAGVVNGGTPVVLNVYGAVNRNIKNSISFKPQVGQDTSQPYTSRISEVQYNAIQNPIVTVRGIIRKNAGSNEITHDLLNQFAECGNTLQLLNTAYGTLNVVIESVDENSNSTNEEIAGGTVYTGYPIHYSIRFVETRA